MSTISGLGGANRAWDSAQQTRRAEQEAKVFAQLDGDGSGGVDATELAAVLKQGGDASSDADGAALLQQMDGNGDGSLSGDELSQGLRELMPPPPSTLDFAQSRSGSDEDTDAFATLDSDGDGQLSRAEFEAGRPAQQQQGPQGAPGAGGPPPAQAGGATDSASATSSTSNYDPLDLNQDGTVSALERLAGQLQEIAQAGSGSDDSDQGANTDIAALAQKLYEQISKNWLQQGSQAQQGVDTSA